MAVTMPLGTPTMIPSMRIADQPLPPIGQGPAEVDRPDRPRTRRPGEAETEGEGEAPRSAARGGRRRWRGRRRSESAARGCRVADRWRSESAARG